MLANKIKYFLFAIDHDSRESSEKQDYLSLRVLAPKVGAIKPSNPAWR